MNRVAQACLLTLAFTFAGCGAPGYRTVELHEVNTIDTEEGRVLALQQRGYLAFREVIERSPNVKTVTRMTDLKGEREPGDFAISPDGKWLVYQSLELNARPYFYNLWRIPTTGGAASTQITSGRYYDLEPAFDSKGADIYFSSNRSSAIPGIWRVKADGAGGIVRVTHGTAVDRTPNLGAGTAHVYYTSTPENATLPQIWRIATNGALPTQLREGRRPRLSPDGTRILYTASDMKTRRSKIWVMDVDGTNQTQLTHDTESDQEYPCWSPDGTKVLFASNEGKDSNGKRNHDIWMIDANGARPTQLTTNGSTDIRPEYSPDGRFVYFLSNRGFNWDIWRMEIAD